MAAKACSHHASAFGDFRTRGSLSPPLANDLRTSAIFRSPLAACQTLSARRLEISEPRPAPRLVADPPLPAPLPRPLPVPLAGEAREGETAERDGEGAAWGGEAALRDGDVEARGGEADGLGSLDARGGEAVAGASPSGATTFIFGTPGRSIIELALAVVALSPGTSSEIVTPVLHFGKSGNTSRL